MQLFMGLLSGANLVANYMILIIAHGSIVHHTYKVSRINPADSLRYV